MAAVKQEIQIGAPVERFYEIVVDYARYPEFVPGIKACRPLGVKGGLREVEYELDLGIKRLRYVLRHEEVRPTRVAWSLVSGDLMKVSNGSWDLSSTDGGTRALYTVEVHLSKPPLVPQAVIDKVSEELTRVQLPRTLHAFKQRAEHAKHA